jgi:hypothetical protein
LKNDFNDLKKTNVKYGNMGSGDAYEYEPLEHIYLEDFFIYLKSKNITTFHLFGGDYHSERFSSPDCTTIENIIDLEFVNIDFGNDNSHPGLESHRTLAKEIYNYVHGVISHK